MVPLGVAVVCMASSYNTEEEREMKTLATCALSIALCLGGMTTLAIRSLGLKSTSSSELHMAASAAFQDGVYLGKLAAESGREMRIAIGRWPSEDRLMFTAGYRRGYNESLASARPPARFQPPQ
jgi:hypothetical protein